VDSPISRQVLLSQKECTSVLFCELMRRVMRGVETAICFLADTLLMEVSERRGLRGVVRRLGKRLMNDMYRPPDC
jgi:hypothetical protein